jgi:hypothetical protein
VLATFRRCANAWPVLGTASFGEQVFRLRS